MNFSVSKNLKHPTSLLMKIADRVTRTKSPDFSLQKISESFYRGSDPSNNLQSLSKKGIKIVLNLKSISNKEYSTLSNEAKKLGIEYVNIPLNPFNVKSNIEDIVKIIKNVSKEKPIFVHCTFGRDRTGFVTALYKNLKQNLNINDAIKDMYSNGFRKIFFPMESFLKTSISKY